MLCTFFTMCMVREVLRAREIRERPVSLADDALPIQLRLTSGFRRAPLAARRPESRCSVAHALKGRCYEWLVLVTSSHSIFQPLR